MRFRRKRVNGQKFTREEMSLFGDSHHEYEQQTRSLEGAIEICYHVSSQQAKEYVSLVGLDPHRALKMNTSTLVKKADLHRIPQIRELISEYRQWSVRCFESEAVMAILSQDTSPESRQAAERLIETECGEGPDIFSEYTSEALIHIQTADGVNSLDHVESLCDLIEKVESSMNQNVAKRMARDFHDAAAIALAQVDPIFRYCVLDLGLPMSVYFIEHRELTLGLVELFQSHIDDYELFVDTAAFKILDHCIEDPSLFSMTDLSPSIRAIGAAGVDMRVLAKAATELDSDTALRFVHKVAKTPQSISVYKSLKKHGTSIRDFLDLLLEDEVYVSSRGQSRFEVIANITNTIPRSASAVCKYARVIFSDPRSEELLEIAGNYAEADRILNAYVSQISLSIRSELIKIGNQMPEPKRLTQLIKECTAKAPLPEKSELYQIPTQIPWQEQISTYLTKEGIDVKNTFNLLGENTNRLRTIWLKQPHNIVDFCRDVATYSSSDFFSHVLGRGNLFAAYQHLLGNPNNYRGDFEELAERKGKLAYQATLEVLLRDTHNPTWVFDNLPSEKISSPEPKSYQTVYIMGGLFNAEEKSFVAQRVSGNIIFASSDREQRNAISNISENCLITWLSQFTGHTSYFAVKHKAKNTGADLIHFNGRNVNLLTELLCEYST